MVVLDAAMNDLIRPAMYGAWHGIVPIAAGALHAAPEITEIVGPICESSDIFARARPLPALPDQAVVAILDAGAYGAVMSSSYNARPPAAQVLVDAALPEAGFALISARPRPEALWQADIIPAPASARRASAA